MNGCLFKTLLIITFIIIAIAGFPYVKQYTSDSMQERFDKLSNSTTIFRKFLRYSSSEEKIKNKLKNNDNSKNKETTK
jgi:hypothetical protein